MHSHRSLPSWFQGGFTLFSAPSVPQKLIHDGAFDFSKVDTKDQATDGFIKALPGPSFFTFRDIVLHRS
jgi:hypothetical protein